MDQNDSDNLVCFFGIPIFEYEQIQNTSPDFLFVDGVKWKFKEMKPFDGLSVELSFRNSGIGNYTVFFDEETDGETVAKTDSLLSIVEFRDTLWLKIERMNSLCASS